MAFSLPQFNLLLDFWQPGGVPNVDPPDISDLPAQLYYGFRSPNQSLGANPVSTSFNPVSIFRLARSPDVTSLIPIVSGYFKWTDSRFHDWYYQIIWWDWDHAKFSNEYLVMACIQCNKDGTTPCTER